MGRLKANTLPSISGDPLAGYAWEKDTSCSGWTR
jgi:hypothetical protein